MKDRGVVLLNALVVISVVAAIAAHLIREDLEARNRYELMLRSDQARVHARAAEALTLHLLALDRDANEVDHLGEAWAEADRVFDIEGAVLAGRVHDLQGRLNVNQLMRRAEDETETDAPPKWQVSGPDMALLTALIKQADGPATLAARIVEWTTDETLDLAGSAGDGPYLRRADPYLRPAQPALAARGLRPVDGMTAPIFAQLSEALTALPGPTAINVNTAPRAVLQAMMPNLRAPQMERLLRYRRDTPFQSRGDFESYVAAIVPVDVAKEIEALDLDVKTNWFLLEVEVQHGNSRARLFSIIKRPDGDSTPSVFLRSSAPL
ncbi:type II secretion system minor pseudopilin GspK (plasmid) [Marinovum sp. KMM 9989]